MIPDPSSLIREMPGMGRCDLSPLLRSADAFRAVVHGLAEPFRQESIRAVAGIDAAGLPFAAGVSLDLGVGLVVARWEGKVAWSSTSEACVDYSGATKRFELVSDAVTDGDGVLIVDDWSETGAQLVAVRRLIEGIGGRVVGCSCVNVDEAARANPGLEGIRVHSVLAYRWRPPDDGGI